MHLEQPDHLLIFSNSTANFPKSFCYSTLTLLKEGGCNIKLLSVVYFQRSSTRTDRDPYHLRSCSLEPNQRNKKPSCSCVGLERFQYAKVDEESEDDSIKYCPVPISNELCKFCLHAKLP